MFAIKILPESEVLYNTKFVLLVTAENIVGLCTVYNFTVNYRPQTSHLN